MKKVLRYAGDNNDIFYWLLDIGKRKRCAIPHLEINWAYEVSLTFEMKNVHGILQNREDMEEPQNEGSTAATATDKSRAAT